MRGRTLAHVGGLLGLAGLATGLALGIDGASLGPEARGPAPVFVVAALDAPPSECGDGPVFVTSGAGRKPVDRPANRAPDPAVHEEQIVRSWTLRAVGPDGEPVPGVRVEVQFKRNTSSCYPRVVGEPVEVTSDAEGIARVPIPGEARSAWITPRAPAGWVAPPSKATNHVDDVLTELGRVMLASSPAAHRTPRIDWERGNPLGAVTIRLDKSAPVSGTVEVPEGFPARRVVVTARWVSPLDRQPAASSVLCGEDGSFLVPVPASAGPVDVEALVTDRPGEPSAWRSVPDGPAAVLIPDGWFGEEPPDPPPPNEPDARGDDISPLAGGRTAATPARVPDVLPGTAGLRLRMEASVSGKLRFVDADGNPTRARLSVVDARGRCVPAWAIGPHAGDHLITGLAAGTYELVASNSAGVGRVRLRLPAAGSALVKLERAEVKGRVAGFGDPSSWYVHWLPGTSSSPGAIAHVQEDGTFRLAVEAGARGRLVAMSFTDDEEHPPAWAEAKDVLADGEAVVLEPRPGRVLEGRIEGLTADACRGCRVRWTFGTVEREVDLESSGTFRLAGLPDAACSLELRSGYRTVARWPDVEPGRVGVVFRLPGTEGPDEPRAVIAEVGLTPEPDGR